MNVRPAKRLALVQERFTEVAGSEQVCEQIAIEWPDAEIHASITRASGWPAGMTQTPRATWLNHPYGWLRHRTYAPLMPLMPRAFRTIPLRDADVVVASHHAFATQCVFATDAPVIAYVHSPARWAWDETLRAGEGGGRLGEMVLGVLSATARRGEVAAAPRLTRILANSSAVADRIQHWWGRESAVVHPPVDTEGFTPDPSIPREPFFLLAGRLVPYKRPEIAIEAANRAGVPLVVAVGEGGAVDTVVPGRTGVHVASGTPQEVTAGLATAIREFDSGAYDPAEIRCWAEGFARTEFRRKMREIVDAI